MFYHNSPAIIVNVTPFIIALIGYLLHIAAGQRVVEFVLNCSNLGLTKHMIRNIFAALGLATFFFLMQSNFAIGIDNDTSQNIEKTLSQLETRFFEHQYETDSDIDRIDRIEQFIFGCNQTGSLTDRIKHIQSAIPDATIAQINNMPSVTTNSPNVSDDEHPDSSNIDQSSDSIDQSNDQSANSSSKSNSQYSSYPRVTSLEQELLGHTYEADTLSRRLARLETKAFGNVSANSELSDRVDNLDDYAQRHDLYGERKIANNTNSSLAFVPPKSMGRGRNNNSVYPTDASLGNKAYAADSQPSYTSSNGSFVGSMEERVAMMEAQEFDHTYPEKPLDKRLKKLEKKILPGQDDSQMGLFQRTSKLWITLHPSDKSKLDNLIAGNQNKTNQAYNPADNTSANSNNSTTTNTASKHGSWLHRLANEIEASANAPYSGYSNFSGNNGGLNTCPYPGSFYVPQSANSPNSRFIGGNFGPGAGPGGLPVGFW